MHKVLWPFLNDVFQRIVTFDKISQRNNLSAYVKRIGLKRHSRVLDFGCGTALFARTFLHLGMEYVGYDIDQRVVAYAAMVYPNGKFVANSDEIHKLGKYDLIVANCCFHHMDDFTIHQVLTIIKSYLQPTGEVLILDIFDEGRSKGALRRLFLMLERGAYLRKVEDYQAIIKQQFKIIEEETQPLLLLPWRCIFNPIASKLIIFRCKTDSN